MLIKIVKEAKLAVKEKEPEAEQETTIPMGMIRSRLRCPCFWNLNITHQVSLILNCILRQEFDPVHRVTLVSKLVRLLDDLLP